MSKVRPSYDDEIDLFELFEPVWDCKLKIIGVILFSALSVFGYQNYQPQTNFEASTEIKPITSFGSENYRQSNANKFIEVTPKLLLTLFIEQLDERTLFEDAIIKHQLLDIEKFADNQAYEEAVIALAASIKILPPINVNGTEVGKYWTVNFGYNDQKKWIQVLSSVNSSANQLVRSALQQHFLTSLSISKKRRDFELEDIQTQINNLLTDYERKTSDRLYFLREQASIARKLGITKGTFETQIFKTQYGMVGNVKKDSLFYLRGYEAIEKEIDLIESREDTRAFIEGLVELEQEKRNLEQDKTLERAELLFNTTPVNTDEFSAASVSIEATDFKFQSYRKLTIVALAGVLGGMVGTMYVLISNAFRKRKEQTPNA